MEKTAGWNKNKQAPRLVHRTELLSPVRWRRRRYIRVKAGRSNDGNNCQLHSYNAAAIWPAKQQGVIITQFVCLISIGSRLLTNDKLGFPYCFEWRSLRVVIQNLIWYFVRGYGAAAAIITAVGVERGSHGRQDVIIILAIHLPPLQHL